MKSLTVKTLICGAIASAQLYAVPVLQLDIIPGTYEPLPGQEDSIPNPGQQTFTLRALLAVSTQDNKAAETAALLADTYYVSTAILPDSGVPSGSFKVNSETVQVPSDLSVGGPNGISPHGVFDALWRQFEFQFDPNQTPLDSYDVEDDSAGPPHEKLYYVDFAIDTQLLDANHFIHFDLYEYGDNGQVGLNNPFSHDARSLNGGGGPPTGDPDPVPDGGATAALLGLGVLGLAALRRK